MTATMILKEIKTLPPREKTKLFKQLDRERDEAEMLEDVRLFDEAKRETAREKPMPLRQFLKQAKIKV